MGVLCLQLGLDTVQVSVCFVSLPHFCLHDIFYKTTIYNLFSEISDNCDVRDR